MEKSLLGSLSSMSLSLNWYSQSKKLLSLDEFISNLSIGSIDPILNDNILDKHLFTISSDDPWYGDILIYLHTKKFDPHLSQDYLCHISHQYPLYLFDGDFLYRREFDTIFHRFLTLTRLRRYSIIFIVVSERLFLAHLFFLLLPII